MVKIKNNYKGIQKLTLFYQQKILKKPKNQSKFLLKEKQVERNQSYFERII